MRWAGAVVSGATAAAVFGLARQLLPLPAAAAAGLAFALYAADPMLQGNAVNTELLMLLPAVAAHLLFVGCLLAPGLRRRRALAVGALVAAAVACKQVAAVNALFFVSAFPLLATGPRRAARWLSFCGWSALGGALVLLAVLAVFAAGDAVPDLLSAVLLHNVEYVAALPPGERGERLAATLVRLAPSQGALWLSGVVGPVWLGLAGERRTALYLLGWLALAAAGVAAGGHAFPHYFLQLLPPLAVGLGAAFARIAAAVRASGGGARAWRGAVLALLLAPPAASLLSFWLPPPEAAPAIRRIHPGNYFDAMPALAEAVARHSPPDGEVFVFGSEPELLFLARRRSASRYIFLFPLYGPFARAAQAQRETAREVRESRPEVIVYLPNAMFFAPGNEHFLTRWIASELHRAYEPRYVASIDPIGRARLQPAPVGTSPERLRPGDYAIVYTRREEGP